MRVCLVTGAAHGIGRSVASVLLAHSWTVGLLDRDKELGESAVDSLSGLGPCRFFPCDVAREGDVKRAVGRALKAWGRIDGLVSNAGRMGERKALEETTLADWDDILQTNLTGYFLMARACAPELRKHRGAIVGIASTRAFQSEPNTFAYSATKGGVVALTHSLAASLAPEVRVNCVSPGWINVSSDEPRAEDHAQHWAGRVGRPEDIGEAVRFLLGSESGFITGSNLIVDGGMTRKMIYLED